MTWEEEEVFMRLSPREQNRQTWFPILSKRYSSQYVVERADGKAVMLCADYMEINAGTVCFGRIKDETNERRPLYVFAAGQWKEAYGWSAIDDGPCCAWDDDQWWKNDPKTDDQPNIRELIQEERKKLTPSLRAHVMKADAHKCRLCGRSAKDKVVLHVDHINPVALGGKTEPANLQTLCSDCNHGKRATA